MPHFTSLNNAQELQRLNIAPVLKEWANDVTTHLDETKESHLALKNNLNTLTTHLDAINELGKLNEAFFIHALKAKRPYKEAHPESRTRILIVNDKPSDIQLKELETEPLFEAIDVFKALFTHQEVQEIFTEPGKEPMPLWLDAIEKWGDKIKKEEKSSSTDFKHMPVGKVVAKEYTADPKEQDRMTEQFATIMGKNGIDI